MQIHDLSCDNVEFCLYHYQYIIVSISYMYIICIVSGNSNDFQILWRRVSDSLADIRSCGSNSIIIKLMYKIVSKQMEILKGVSQ